MLNRHGLIAGATGTGKTKTVQVIAEAMSEKGIPIMLMDLKGDLSGLAVAGNNHPKIQERHEKIGFGYTPEAFPVELLSLSDEKGAKLRATVIEFGPVLFSKILELNDTQSGIVSIIFKYCDDRGLLLVDLKDFKEVLGYVTDEGKEEFEDEYGRISSASVGTILRKIIEIEQQGADKFFGEPSFEPEDLMQVDENGKGLISILRLTDIQDRPKLFSTFMLSLLAEIYANFPEQGDADKPKLCLFIDEAHLVFNNASKALIEQIENIVRLIRSKGVGVYFITQNPSDVPDAILSQLGMKVQHALRAFTAKDRKMIKSTAENYPISEFYETDEMLTSMGIGEAAITVLDEKGRPTPLVHCLLRAPRTRMDILSNLEINGLVAASKLSAKYNVEIDRESAYEILKEKIEFAERAKAEEEQADEKKVVRTKKVAEEKGVIEQLSKNTMIRQLGREVTRQVTRGLLGALGIKSTRRSSRRGGWF
ncbi:UNVERIFIED_CONTAM: hypothetical protein GTU68_040298 [Idotea baltica]|nr:hypothetical protein [Idotea baltica]